MNESTQEPQGGMSESTPEPQPDLDSVFSTFFQKVEKLKPIAKPRSAKDYLQTNRDKIIHALSKGYTYLDLAEMLKDCGFSISASTLRRYIGAVKGRKGDAFKLEVSQDPATDSAEVSEASNPDPTTVEEYQTKLRPRRK